MIINILTKFLMNFGSKLFPLECTQAKKLTDGCLVRHGRPHVWRATDIAVSQKLILSKLRWAKKNNKKTGESIPYLFGYKTGFPLSRITKYKSYEILI